PAGRGRRLVDRAARKVGVLDVALDQQAARPARFDELAGLLRVAPLLSVEDRDARRALGREVHGDRPADPAVAAGDHAVPAGEALRAEVAVADDLGPGLHPVLVPGLLRLALARKAAFGLAHRHSSSSVRTALAGRVRPSSRNHA